MMLFLAFPLSVVVGAVALYSFYLLDQRIHDGDKIESSFGVPVWTSLPDRTCPGTQCSPLPRTCIGCTAFCRWIR